MTKSKKFYGSDMKELWCNFCLTKRKCPKSFSQGSGIRNNILMIQAMKPRYTLWRFLLWQTDQVKMDPNFPRKTPEEKGRLWKAESEEVKQEYQDKYNKLSKV